MIFPMKCGGNPLYDLLVPCLIFKVYNSWADPKGERGAGV